MRYTYYDQDECLGLPLREPVDHELAECGLLKPGINTPGWFISDAGASVFGARFALEAAARAPHNELAERASRWLQQQGRRVWINRAFRVHLKSDLRVMKNLGIASAHSDYPFPELEFQHVISRPDVISVVSNATRSGWQTVILEVKVKKADFLKDINNPVKRYAYALLAEQIFYVCPAGLVSEDEVPDGCGLIYETQPATFMVIRAPLSCKPQRSAHINRLLRTDELLARFGEA